MTTLDGLPFALARLRAGYAKGLRPADVMDEVLARLERIGDPAIFIHLRDRDALRAEAEALGPYDPDRPLWGIPFAVKDNIDVAGIDTTAGCPACAYRPTKDAFVVARLRAAGALVIGKTNMDQFATGLVGLCPPHGAPLNCVDPEIGPGEFSSGPAVALGHGAVAFALGTDTPRSGRMPAALNNIVGLKPTLGALSARSVVPACRSIETLSILAPTVDDAWAVFVVAEGNNPMDDYARPVDPGTRGAAATGLGIGVPSDASARFFGDDAQHTAFARDIAQLARMGADVRPVDFAPFYAISDLPFDGPWIAERHNVIGDFLEHSPKAIHPVTRRTIAPTADLSAGDIFQGFCRLAVLKRAAAPAMDGLDMPYVPAMPCFPTLDDLAMDPVGPNSRMGTYTSFANLIGICAIAVPTAPRRDGRHGGVTGPALAGQDAAIASVSRTFENGCIRRIGGTAFDLPPRAPLPSTPVSPDTPHHEELL